MTPPLGGKPSGKRGAALDLGARFAKTAGSVGQAQDATAAAAEQERDRGAVVLVPVASLRRSPFQPAGRPSPIAEAAVSTAVEAAGSLAALVARDAGAPAPGASVREFRHPAFRALSADAQALAELAGDIGRHGLTEPIDVRTVPPDAEGRTLELVSGHRRRAAAGLAGLADVPARSLGTITDAEAAALVFARNRLRADFGPFEEAQALATLRRLQGGTLHALAASLGYSHARAGILLQAAAAFDEATRAELAGGDVDAGTAAVASLSYRQLRELVPLAGDRAAFLTAARQVTRLAPPAPTSTAVEAGATTIEDVGADVVRWTSGRSGVSVTIARTPGNATPAEAAAIVAALDDVAARFRRRARRASKGSRERGD